jgi:Flp pilus assembly protein TadD
MTRIHLRRFGEAITDLKEAYETDTKVRALCRALNARIVGLQGHPEKNDSVLKSLLKENKNDPKFLTILARIELDTKSFGVAAKYLQQASEFLPYEPELQLALAWVLTQNNANSKLALEAATNVTIRTGYRDWNSLAALANVQMMMHRKELAAETIRTARALAPASAKELCAQWQTEIDSDNIIKRKWE